MTTHWLDVNGVSIRAVEQGRGPRTLVLVHEMGGSLESWDWVVPLLPLPRKKWCVTG